MVYYDSYEAVIGLEVHAQINTKSKIFCGCSTAFGAEPNTQVCPVCLGLPGVLPVLNRQVLVKAVLAGLAMHARISRYCRFARKQYFYPDLPKAYQISQYEEPICTGGYLEISDDNGSPKRIALTRIHMEEDAGKLVHDPDGGRSYVDLNRTGVPLIEIVSEPQLRSPREAYEYMISLRSILRYADVSDGNMEEGSLRCDANVSVRKIGESRLGTRTETKNLNSFKAVRASIQYEIERQIRLLESGENVIQQTRLWDPDRGVTRAMREKDDAHDYRYFPDPDLVPIVLEDSFVEELSASLPEMPARRKRRLEERYGLSAYDAGILVSDKSLADYFEKVVSVGSAPKTAANWILSEALSARKERSADMDSFPVSPEALAELIGLIDDQVISGKIAKQVFAKMVRGEGSATEIVDREGLRQLTNVDDVAVFVDEVIRENEAQVKEYRSGKEKVFGFFVGQVMKKTRGKANPKLVNDLLRRKLRS